jgi:hypothetical protein
LACYHHLKTQPVREDGGMSAEIDTEARAERGLTIGDLARAIERGSIQSAVRGADYEITWREANRLRRGLADAWLLFQPGGGEQIGPGGEDISQAV